MQINVEHDLASPLWLAYISLIYSTRRFIALKCAVITDTGIKKNAHECKQYYY